MVGMLRALVLVVVTVASARAEPQPETRRVSYGHQIAITDAIAAGLLGAGIAGTATQHGTARGLSIAAIAAGGATYWFGGPFVHRAHQPTRDRYYESFLLRSLGPALVAGLAIEVASHGCEKQDFTCDRMMIAGGVALGVSMIAVSLVDITWLAYDRVVVAPAVTPSTVGLAGRF